MTVEKESLRITVLFADEETASKVINNHLSNLKKSHYQNGIALYVTFKDEESFNKGLRIIKEYC